MKNYQLTIACIAVAFAFAFGVTGCNQSEPKNSSEATAANPLEAHYQQTAPANAKHISEVFADAKPGKEVVVHGEVMGRMNVFVDGRAMVVLGDPTKITPCNRIPGDGCVTPWDVCCDPPEIIKKSIATIQFLSADGRVIKQGLKGFKGIKELSFLTVKGIIAEGTTAENLLISAQEFHLTDPSPFAGAPPVPVEQNEPEYSPAIEHEGVIYLNPPPVPMDPDDTE